MINKILGVNEQTAAKPQPCNVLQDVTLRWINVAFRSVSSQCYVTLWDPCQVLLHCIILRFALSCVTLFHMFTVCCITSCDVILTCVILCDVTCCWPTLSVCYVAWRYHMFTLSSRLMSYWPVLRYMFLAYVVLSCVTLRYVVWCYRMFTVCLRYVTSRYLVSGFPRWWDHPCAQRTGGVFPASVPTTKGPLWLQLWLEGLRGRPGNNQSVRSSLGGGGKETNNKNGT